MIQINGLTGLERLPLFSIGDLKRRVIVIRQVFGVLDSGRR
jgi:hypothetical protein